MEVENALAQHDRRKRPHRDEQRRRCPEPKQRLAGGLHEQQRRQEREQEIGEPFGADRPGRIIPRPDVAPLPGVDHQQVQDDLDQAVPLRIGGRLADDFRTGDKQHVKQQCREMQRINSRNSLHQKALVVERARLDLRIMGVRKNEAAQDEKEIHAQRACGEDGNCRHARVGHPFGIMMKRHPEGREKSQRGEDRKVPGVGFLAHSPFIFFFIVRLESLRGRWLSSNDAGHANPPIGDAAWKIGN